MRQSCFADCAFKPGVSIIAQDYACLTGLHIPEHTHLSDQIVYVVGGMLELWVEESFWLVPPRLAVWIPAHTTHQFRIRGDASGSVLFLKKGLTARPTAGCSVMDVSAFLRELILEAVRIGEIGSRICTQRGLKDLLASQVMVATPVRTGLALPREARALGIAWELLADLADSRTLHALCLGFGASVRTIERIYQRDLGIKLESWRKQARLVKAIEMLVEGHSVNEVALAVGYQQPSAFISMFRRSLGATPSAWAKGREIVRRGGTGERARPSAGGIGLWSESNHAMAHRAMTHLEARGDPKCDGECIFPGAAESSHPMQRGVPQVANSSRQSNL